MNFFPFRYFEKQSHSYQVNIFVIFFRNETISEFLHPPSPPRTIFLPIFHSILPVILTFSLGWASSSSLCTVFLTFLLSENLLFFFSTRPTVLSGVEFVVVVLVGSYINISHRCQKICESFLSIRHFFSHFSWFP